MSVRLFIGIELSEDAKKRCDFAIRALAESTKGVRVGWVKPENLHITLRFLGTTRVQDIPFVESSLRQETHRIPPFSVRLGSPHAVPERGPVQMVWAEVAQGGKELEKLADAVNRALKDLGFPAEDRKFRAHLTLGRVKERAFTRKVLEKVQYLELGGFDVSEILLYESQTLRTGAEYRILSRFRLSG